MHCIEIPKGMNNLMSLFYYLGLWHRGDRATVRETRIKLFYCFYYVLFPISLMVGVITSDSKDEAIFLAEIGIVSCVMSVKLFYIIWRKDQIIEMLTRIGVYSMDNHEEFILTNDKLKRFVKFVIALFLISCTAGYTAAIIPIFVKERKLFFNIGFPLDWKNNDFAFWLANAFIFSEITLSLLTILFSVIIWYLMLTCAMRYEILGSDIRNMGVRPTNETTIELQILVVEKQHFFLHDLILAIDSHQHIRGIIRQLESFFAKIFFIQIVTSVLCIRCSIYCLAFNVGENLVERLIDLATLWINVYEIFMILYFGNAIKLSSDRLSYCLFESDWIDQPQETKNIIIIFGELLKQPHELVIGKYPLTLETFRRILNVACFNYNTFNILKSLK